MATIDTNMMSKGVTAFTEKSNQKSDRSLRKTRFLNKFLNKCTTYDQIILFTIDNIPTGHLQLLRSQLRQDKASLMFGKNTLIRRALKNLSAQYDPNLAKLIPYLKTNVGCLFAYNTDVLRLMYFIEEHGVTANAKPGMIAPCDVTLRKGVTSLPPDKTSFFQASGIHTKISGGKIEILKDTFLVKEGEPVTETAYRVLELMKMRPFSYYMKVKAVYDQGELIDLNLIKQAEKLMKKGLENVRLVDKFISKDQNLPIVEGCGMLPDSAVVNDGDDNDGEEGEGMFNIFGDEEEQDASSVTSKGKDGQDDGDDGDDTFDGLDISLFGEEQEQ